MSGSSSANYVRVDGLTYDSKGNLDDQTAGNGNGGICILKLTEHGFPIRRKLLSLENQNLIDKVLITSNGDKWQTSLVEAMPEFCFQ